MTDKQRETYPISNVGECPFCHKNSNYVERMTLDSCAVICDCGAQGPSSCPESDEDNEIEDENDLDPGYLAAVRLWKTQQASGAEPVFYTAPGAVDTARALNSTIGVSPVQDEYFSELLFLGPQPPKAVPDSVHELISAVRSINRAAHHQVKIEGDDEPCYWQRQEWVEWVLGLADSAEADISDHPGPSTTACDDQEAPDE